MYFVDITWTWKLTSNPCRAASTVSFLGIRSKKCNPQRIATCVNKVNWANCQDMRYSIVTIDITTVFFRKQGLLLFNVHDIQSICTKDNIIGGFEGGLELSYLSNIFIHSRTQLLISITYPKLQPTSNLNNHFNFSLLQFLQWYHKMSAMPTLTSFKTTRTLTKLTWYEKKIEK